MNVSAEHISIDLAKAALSKRLATELSNLDADPQAAVIQLIQAEKTLESYLSAVDNKMDALPERRAIAWSCLVLLIIGDEFNEEDYDTVARIYATDIDISLHDIAPKVEQMRDRIIAKWESQLDGSQPQATPVYKNSPF